MVVLNIWSHMGVPEGKKEFAILAVCITGLFVFSGYRFSKVSVLLKRSRIC